MPLANGDSSADTTTRRNAEDFLAILLKVPKELHARLISPWLTGERGIGDGTRRPELEKMTAISLVCARFLKFLEGFWP
uniref:Uncharacterized protein n=1 Tax=Oryza nivara TaxID=4536 RepID=A0A0E0IZP7_ORYNI